MGVIDNEYAINVEVGRALRVARIRAGLTQRDLALRTGVAQPTIARIEGERADPRTGTLERLLMACGEHVEAMPRIGQGVDRTLIADMRARPPRERIRLAAADARGWAEFIEAAQRRDRVGVTGAESFDPLRALEAFARHAVEHVLIGALAGRAHGSPVITGGVDICPAVDVQNLERLSRALGDLHVDDGELPLDPDGLRYGARVAFLSDVGEIGVVVHPLGTRGFDDLRVDAEQLDLGEFSVLAASVTDLIRMKRWGREAKDRLAGPELEALREEIEGIPR